MYQTHEKKKMAIVYNGFISQKWMIGKAKSLNNFGSIQNGYIGTFCPFEF